jgi:hypothetical protein
MFVILQNHAEGQVRQFSMPGATRGGLGSIWGWTGASVLQSFADEEYLVMPAQRAEPGLG